MSVVHNADFVMRMDLKCNRYLYVCDGSESQGLEPICIALGENNTAWALDTSGSLWFRSGVTAKNPQGEDDHWWQV